MVPTMSMVFMGVSALVSVGLPVVLFLALRKKLNMKAVPALVGVAGFVLFAMVLEQLMHMAVLRPDAGGNIALIQERPALYVLYGIFAAGIFEETARLLGFMLLKKRYSGPGTGFAYGIGHGGIESAMMGITMASNLVISLMLNAGTLPAEMQATLPANALSQLAELAPATFLAGGLERIFALSIQISLSMLVWLAVNKKSSGGRSLIWLYPAAILLHAFVDLFAALYQIGRLTNIWVIEGVIALFALILPLLAWAACRKSK